MTTRRNHEHKLRAVLVDGLQGLSLVGSEADPATTRRDDVRYLIDAHVIEVVGNRLGYASPYHGEIIPRLADDLRGEPKYAGTHE